MKFYKKTAQPIIVFVVLVFGFIVANMFTLFKEETLQQENVQTEYRPLVEIVKGVNQNINFTVNGFGAIRAQTRVDIVPQVGGKVVNLNSSARSGGYFHAGEVLLEIESIDFELNIVEAKSLVASAETVLEMERAESVSAKEEWKELNPNKSIPNLVSRGPHIKQAITSLEAAQARLTRARLNLSRTKVSLPFDGRIIDITTDVGSIISSLQKVGTAYSDEIFEISVPLDPAEIAWMSIPDNNGIGGSSGYAIISSEGENLRLPVKVVRIASELDPITRLATVIVELKKSDLKDARLVNVFPGQFVNVEIIGKEAKNLMKLPRSVLRSNNQIWIVDEGKIDFYTPDIVRTSSNSIFISGANDSLMIVNSDLRVVTRGMRVRVQGDAK